mgnify:CR=1 FL=1|tara:strand:+ start:4561 stop:5610 length:1050 start_codon:yes stop_codon:yes gene_type:complete
MFGTETTMSTVFPEIQFGDQNQIVKSPTWFTWAYAFGRFLVENEQALEAGLIVVTSPCQSPLIGAVGLGALVKLLERQTNTTDNDKYFEQLFSLPTGTLVRWKPKRKARTKVFKLLKDRCRKKGIKMRQVSGSRKDSNASYFLTQQAALSYVVDSVEQTDPDLTHSLSRYPGAAIIEKISQDISPEQNWRNNLDDIVFAGPTGGHSSPKKQMTSTRLFYTESHGMGLHELLAVKEWIKNSQQTPHFSRFLNSSKNKKEIPQIVKKSRFVFYNSIDSFLRFTDRFESQVQVLVSSRNVDSNKLERLLGKLHSYKERAVPVAPEIMDQIPCPPVGLQLIDYGSKKKREKKW